MLFFREVKNICWGRSLSFLNVTSILEERPSKMLPKFNSGGDMMTWSLVILNFNINLTGKTCYLIYI